MCHLLTLAAGVGRGAKHPHIADERRVVKARQTKPLIHTPTNLKR